MLKKSVFRKAFIARTAEARKRTPYGQEEMAVLLGLGRSGQGTYKQYETRSLLPHYLVPRFCLICGVLPQWLYDLKASEAKPKAARPFKRHTAA